MNGSSDADTHCEWKNLSVTYKVVVTMCYDIYVYSLVYKGK
jgi:hypothetical protein